MGFLRVKRMFLTIQSQDFGRCFNDLARVDSLIVVLLELKSSIPSQSVIIFFFRSDFMDRALCEKIWSVTYSMDLELDREEVCLYSPSSHYGLD